MINNQFKNQLFDIYGSIHQYVYHTLAHLDAESYNWTPANTKARSISSYFRHVVNAEIYWLQAIEKNTIPYIAKQDSFNDMIEKYKLMEETYKNLLNKASEKDLEIRETKYIQHKDTENLEIIQTGTLAWTILRISLHALGHISQITYILYSLGVRGEENAEFNWWNVTEKIIALGNLAKT